tara:strand:+ start:191 stop:412 length:222 start_codon:yes stop_codon:yes gene_type:complete
MARQTRRMYGGSRRRVGGKKTARKTKRRGGTRKRRGGDLGTNLLPFLLMAAKHGYQRARGHNVHRKKSKKRRH